MIVSAVWNTSHTQFYARIITFKLLWQKNTEDATKIKQHYIPPK